MSGTCRTYWRQGICIRNLVDRPEGKRPLEDLGIDGSKILK
jgi:hypothetical protein